MFAIDFCGGIATLCSILSLDKRTKNSVGVACLLMSVPHFVKPANY
jgi:hypothetical protein